MGRDASLDFQDYLDAAGDAAKRTRTVTIVLVVASVLTFVGFLNSLPNGWIAERLKTLGKAGVALNKKPDSWDEEDKKSLAYLKEKLGPIPERYADPKKQDVETHEYEQYKDQYKELYVAMVRTYADNTFTIRVPFFGIGFDINYLGLLSGLGFVIILTLFRFCITRELDNVKLSFQVAKKRTALWEFYHLLAMRQVLTIPPMEIERKFKLWSFIIATIPKLICFLPFVIYAFLTWNDVRTSHPVGENISKTLTDRSLYSDYFFLLLILLFTVACYWRWTRVDKVWNEYWGKAQEERTFKEKS
jgi:hypothetical protein